ncbi:MAG: hypothetical protein IH889_11380 [Planctomycetes bacterium]|nr:hypothetical protein [Planctomycetota bacterium]
MRMRIFVGSVALAGAVITVAQLNAGDDIRKTTGRSNTVADSGGVAGVIGPDVIYTNMGSISNYGPVGGIRAYSLGSHTCNIGDQNLLWLFDGTPGLAMNAYRLHDGLLMQIGMSWVKHACCAAAGSGCGMACNGQGGNVLGVGCRDVYGSGYNAIQSNLGPRSGINAYSGAFSTIPGGSGDAIFRRLQVAESDLSSTNYPGALYFAEGVYAATDDAQNANWLNNASYKRVTISPSFVMSEAGSIYLTTPAIYAWRDHGNGVGIPDNTVQIVNADVPGEGRFIVGARAGDNGDGTWRYNYAVFNLNSHRSGGSFSLPVPSGVMVSNVGFHDVPYHSGEPYDNTDWTSTVGATSVSWSSPQTYAENPDSNALRWGTMYTFWFDADSPPTPATVEIGLFRPGSPALVTANALGPTEPITNSPDLNGDGCVDSKDLTILLGAWCSAVNDPNPPSPPCENCTQANLDLADIVGPFGGPPDGCVDSADLTELLGEWCSVAGGNPCGTCPP